MEASLESLYFVGSAGVCIAEGSVSLGSALVSAVEEVGAGVGVVLPGRTGVGVEEEVEAGAAGATIVGNTLAAAPAALRTWI